ncbi:G-type lectin S-receptor-like serine/threonine-protein kinase SD2-5 [Populus alba]|uniref:G-type lectin S-receptor-like serine/threonine-protein kinase SD2-5 n=1 Tax=Populus alba TaxID=43335 RepID=UPI00158ABDC2|nr:G-type lectin S-receptor-like serine/threonine-protein kinase SD2-5 [Populus alba]
MEDFLDQLPGMPTRFTYEELKAATKDFHTKLGKGGFGSVFEGNLETGEKIAVKRLEGLGQGKKEFLAEVKTIGSIHHVNLVRLTGFCVDKLSCLLVYEFLCNGSLDSWIFLKEPRQPSLDWEGKRTIILDIARGQAYLHEECRQRIIHLDIKPQNILLDARLRAKISDFGLSKLIDRDQSQVVTTMRGTPGYLAPELFSSVITEKADVYSFGIVVMEVVYGKKNLDRSQPECMHLLPILMKRAQEDQLIDMVDNSSEDMQLHRLEAAEMMRVAIWCLQSDHTRRPSMSTVVKVLEGTMGVEADLDYLPSECNNNGSNKKRGSAGQYYHIAAITTIRTKVKKDLLRYICGVYVSPIGVLPSVLFIPLV